MPAESLRQLDWNELINTALTVEGSVGNTYNRFYNYSFMNQMFLRMQGVNEPVATYKRWQSLGRQVVKGAKAKAIIRPIIIEKKNPAGEVEDRFRRFKAVNCLFPVSDTEGDELPPADLPSWNIATAHEELDIKEVPFAHLDGNIQGYSIGRDYALNPVAVDPNRTRFHEIAHITLGHTMDDDAMRDYAMHRGLSEFEAEGTAHLVMNELELMTPDRAAHSRGYLQHWLRGETPPDASIRHVFKATDVILRAGRQITEAVG